MPELGDHYRPTRDGPDSDDSHAPGVYRVVGVRDDVTLLRVTDADGRRAHTGEVQCVSPETLAAEFEPAENPDAGLNPVGTLRNLLQGLYWDVRRLL